jgi:hypothetical protein
MTSVKVELTQQTLPTPLPWTHRGRCLRRLEHNIQVPTVSECFLNDNQFPLHNTGF